MLIQVVQDQTDGRGVWIRGNDLHQIISELSRRTRGLEFEKRRPAFSTTPKKTFAVLRRL